MENDNFGNCAVHEKSVWEEIKIQTRTKNIQKENY